MHLTDTKIIYRALCLVSILLSACGGGGSGGAAPGTTTVRSAYVANSGDNTISQYTMDAGGALTPKGTPTVASISGVANSNPTSVTVDPSGKNAYVANSGNEVISQFSIGTGGGLVPMNPATVASGSAGSGPTSVTVDPTGKYAYAANSSSYEVAQFTIGAGGGLVPMTPAFVTSGTGTFFPGPVAVTVDPTGKYVYVANQGDNYVTQFTIGAGGVLAAMTPQATVATGTNPISVTVDPTGKYAYVANYGSNYISQYNIGVSGALSPMSTPTATTPGLTLPTSIAIDPTGKYAYVANGLGVAQFLIGQVPGPGIGALTPMIPPTVFSSGFSTEQSITVDASGKYVYMANQSGVVAQYTIGVGGLLTAMTPQATVAAGSLPYSITTAVSIQ